MIDRLCQEISTGLDSLERLEQSAGDTTAINSTKSQLEEVKAEVARLSSKCLLLRHKLAPVVVDNIMDNTVKIHEQLKASQQAFYSQNAYNQSSELRKIKNDLKAQLDKLEENWRTQTERVLKPLEIKLKLVRYLPAISTQKSDLDRHFEGLRPLRTKSPVNEVELRRFEDVIDLLEKKLQETDGLEPSVASFLEKVSDNRATLADLDDEIIVWSRQKNRARSFMVVFHE